jgi:hypothetical protein
MQDLEFSRGLNLMSLGQLLSRKLNVNPHDETIPLAPSAALLGPERTLATSP